MAETKPSTLELSADALIVRGLPAGLPEGRLDATFEQALQKVGERLSRSPLARAGFRRLALEKLTLGTLSADELLSDRGASLLADELYAALVRVLPALSADSPAPMPHPRTP